MRSETVHFSIEGGFITDTARNFLAEGNPSKAFDLIAGCLIGISMDQAAQVLCGRMRLEGTNEITMVEDDPSAPDPIVFMTGLLKQADEGNRVMSILKPWRDAAGVCHLGYNAPPRKSGPKARGSPAGLMSEKVAQRYAGADGDAVPSMLMQIFPAFSTDEYETFFERNLEDMTELVTECHPWTRTRSKEIPEGTTIDEIRAQKVAEMGAEKLAKIAEITTKVRVAPKTADITKHDSGWLSPDGKFYACEYSGHENLAADLGKGGKELEALGWIHISMGGLMGPPIRALMRNTEKEVTQAQINKIFDYCEATKMELPEWAGGTGSGFKHYS